MHQRSTFDRLVSELNAEQRMAMLKSIESSASIEDGPLYASSEETENVNLELEYNRTGIVKRIILLIKALLSQRTVIDVFEDSMMKGYSEEVGRVSRGLYDARSNALSARFAEEIKNLRDSISCFAEPLSRAFGHEKKEFVAFLAGFEIPLHQERLLEITNPTNYGSGEITNSDIRRRMLADISSALKDISESDRAEVYAHIRSLYFLNELVFYPFSRIIEQYDDPELNNGVAIERIKEPLMELGDVLVSQGRPPGQNALKAIFLFNAVMDDEAEPDAMASFLKNRLDQAYKGISTIRKFGALLPYKKLLKICSGNVGYSPETIGGGEDWFALYRAFWEERAETTLEEFTFKHKKRDLLRDACALLKQNELPLLKYYSSKSSDTSIRIQYETSLSFVHQFVEKLLLGEMHRVLKIFLVDADFYKSQNRKQFTDSYTGLQNAGKEIAKLEADLGADENSGSGLRNHLEQADGKSSRGVSFTRVLDDVNERAESIVISFREELGLFIDVVKGILFGESGGRFDTLSNISYIGGSENAKLIDRMNNSLKQAEEARRITNEFFDLERTSQE